MGVRQAHRALWHLDDLDVGKARAQALIKRGRIGERALMREQHPTIGDGDHVIVEGAGGDGLGRLPGEQHPVGVEPMQARDRFAGLTMLARREGAAASPIDIAPVDEDLDSCRIVRRGEPHVIGGALVAERRRHGVMHREMTRIPEGDAQLRQRPRPFMAAMRHGDEVGDGEMASPVRRVRGRRDRRGIGGPHRRGGQRVGAQHAVGRCHGQAEAPQPASFGRSCGKKMP